MNHNLWLDFPLHKSSKNLDIQGFSIGLCIRCCIITIHYPSKYHRFHCFLLIRCTGKSYHKLWFIFFWTLTFCMCLNFLEALTTSYGFFWTLTFYVSELFLEAITTQEHSSDFWASVSVFPNKMADCQEDSARLWRSCITWFSLFNRPSAVPKDSASIGGSWSLEFGVWSIKAR